MAQEETKMKKVSALRLGLAITGSFLGAGYVSGQELWQFFGRFGAGALPGLVLAMVLIGVFGVLIMELSRRTGILEMDRLVIERDIPLLRGAMSVLQTVMLFGFVVIMCAGSAALCRQQWGVPTVVGGAVFSAVVAAVSLLGLTGLVNVFSALVPALSVVSVIAAAVVLSRTGMPMPGAAEESFGGWPVSAGLFFAYNVFGVIGVLIPLGHLPENGKTLRRGVAIGCVGLAVIAVGVLAAMFAVPSSEDAELPMLAIVTEYLPWLATPYALVLIAVMFGASLACLLALVTFLEEKFAAFRTYRVLWTAVIMTAALVGSFAGFSDLIGIVYPVFGWCGVGFLVLLVLHWYHVRQKEKTAR